MNSTDRPDDLPPTPDHSINRRQFVGRTAAAAGGLALGSGLLAACQKGRTPRA